MGWGCQSASAPSSRFLGGISSNSKAWTVGNGGLPSWGRGRRIRKRVTSGEEFLFFRGSLPLGASKVDSFSFELHARVEASGRGCARTDRGPRTGRGASVGKHPAESKIRFQEALESTANFVRTPETTVWKGGDAGRARNVTDVRGRKHDPGLFARAVGRRRSRKAVLRRGQRPALFSARCSRTTAAYTGGIPQARIEIRDPVATALRVVRRVRARVGSGYGLARSDRAARRDGTKRTVGTIADPRVELCTRHRGGLGGLAVRDGRDRDVLLAASGEETEKGDREGHATVGHGGPLVAKSPVPRAVKVKPAIARGRTCHGTRRSSWLLPGPSTT